MSPLILLLAGWATWVGTASEQTVIQYVPYAVNKTCEVNARRNGSLADGALFTFNFKDGDAYKVFQVPRCLFDTEVAREIFASVDLSETLESYRARFRLFFVPALFGLFRLIAREKQSSYHDLGLSPPPASTVTMRDFPLDLTHIHRLPQDKLCTITGHPLMFDLRVPCSHQALRWAGNAAGISLTPHFFILTVGPEGHDERAMNQTITLFFGRLHQIDLKAPYSAQALLYRQTEKHDLLTLVRDGVARGKFYYLTDRDLLEKALSTNYEEPTTCLRMLSSLAAKVLRTGQCGARGSDVLSRGPFELLFAYALCLSTLNGVSYALDNGLAQAAWRQSEIELIGEFIQRCFGTSTGNPTPRFAERARSHPHRDETEEEKADPYATLAGLATGMHYATLADLAYLFRETQIPPRASRDALLNELFHVVDAYYRESLRRRLQASERRVLLRVSATIRAHLNESQEARLLYMLLASMCSPKEVLAWSEALYDQRLGGPSHTFSPCLSGARRDYSTRWVKELLRLARQPETHTQAVMLASERLRPARRELADEASCLPEEIPTVTVTAPGQTYVVSSQYLLRGPVYPVSNTVVGKTLLVTSVERRSRCVHSTSYREHATISILKNVTFTERCELCGSTLVEYDETLGVTSLIYIANAKDLEAIAAARAEILAATPRIHYLLLSANGTVSEVTNILVEIKAVSYPIIATAAVMGVLALLGIYSACRRAR